MKLYSWKDVERQCLIRREDWQSSYNEIDIYPDRIIAYKKEKAFESLKSIFEKLFPLNFKADQMVIQLDIGRISIPIIEELSEGSYERPTIPQFKKALYQKTSYTSEDLPALACPIICFHSYKGGVGRTLALLAFAKAWSAVFETSKEKEKLLIIDSDIEAPGLTWVHENLTEEVFSYLDLLALIQDGSDVDEIVRLACSKIGSASIAIETPRKIIEHIFIPTHRYLEQLLDLYASPASIVNGYQKGYILAEVLAKLGTALGVSAVLVDLRAGLSEFSSTLLLDQRVKKYLVTSTSKQSIEGTLIVLDFLTKGLRIKEDTLLPEIFLNMVPEGLSETEKNNIIAQLMGTYELHSENNAGAFVDDVVTELPFASELIHLTSLKQIFQNLNGRDMYFRIEKLIKQNYSSEEPRTMTSVSADSRIERLGKIHQIARDQLTAENNSRFELLLIEPLKNLKQLYRDNLPTAVIMGAKGAGKTFLYRILAENTNWLSFQAGLNHDKDKLNGKNDGYFLPVIATRSSNMIIQTLTSCIKQLNATISCAQTAEDVFLKNSEQLLTLDRKTANWYDFWETLLSTSFNPAYTTLAEVNHALEIEQKRIIFLIDGLEDYFRDVSKSEEEQLAIQVLCQDMVNILKAKYPQIGIIVFLRRDMAQDAITVNWAQFRQIYEKIELKWSSNEAKRLAVWLVDQADKTVYSFYKENIEIDVASNDIIDECLVQLWGLKLGKPTSNEAHSSRWILAALSDFNGQLQARDIIRFLQYATESPARRPPYDDRLLMPTEIKQAVQMCSTEKMDEIKQEYAVLKPIFERLQSLPIEQKTLPLKQSVAKLDASEEKRMMQEGYLKRDGDVFYLPEIVRHALGLRYEKGARPKVLSLVLKR